MTWSDSVVRLALDWCRLQWEAGAPASLELSCLRLGGAAPTVPMSAAHPASPDAVLPPGLAPAECLVLSDAHGARWFIEPGGSLLDVPLRFDYRGRAYEAVRQFSAEFHAASGVRAPLYLLPTNLLMQSSVEVCSRGSARDALSSILAGLRRRVCVLAIVSIDCGLGLNLGAVERVSEAGS